MLTSLLFMLTLCTFASMAAPLTTEQAADLAQYKDIVQYLTNILNLNIAGLSDANKTKINDTVASALDNTQAILTVAAP